MPAAGFVVVAAGLVHFAVECAERLCAQKTASRTSFALSPSHLELTPHGSASRLAELEPSEGSTSTTVPRAPGLEACRSRQLGSVESYTSTLSVSVL